VSQAILVNPNIFIEAFKKNIQLSEDMPESVPAAVATSNKESSPDSSSDDTSSESSGDFRRQPIMVKRGVTGTVRFFSRIKRYGFISIDEDIGEHNNSVDANKEKSTSETDKKDQKPSGEEKEKASDGEAEKKKMDIFVHWGAIVTQRGRAFCALRDNDKVEFDVFRGVRGLEATAVTLAGGEKVPLTYFIEGPRRVEGPPRRIMPGRFNRMTRSQQQRKDSKSENQASVRVVGDKDEKQQPIEKKRDNEMVRRPTRRRTYNKVKARNAAEKEATDDEKKQDEGGEKQRIVSEKETGDVAKKESKSTAVSK
jgi:cold shock CspA family protein